MKKILFSLLFLVLGVCYCRAQEPSQLVVYSVTGNPELVVKKSKRPLKLREKLSLDDVINIPYNAVVELIDIDAQKQYVIKTVGRTSVRSLIKDQRNSPIQLTKRYFNYVFSQLQGKSQVVSRRCSDPATVTRDSLVVTEDSTILITKYKE